MWPENMLHWIVTVLAAAAFLINVSEICVRYLILNGKVKKPAVVLLLFFLGTRGTILAHLSALTSIILLGAGLGRPIISGLILWSFYALQEKRFEKLVFGVLSKAALCMVVISFVLGFDAH